MADFGDYAAPYLTMARQAPENVDRLARLDQAMRDAPIRRRALEAEAATAEEKARYQPQMLMAELYGSPFQREVLSGQQKERQIASQRAQLNTDRLLAQQAEQMRRNAASERLAAQRELRAQRLAEYNAALKAYEMGLGDHPGPFPTDATTSVSAQPSGQPPQEQRPQQAPKMPDDIAKLPPGMRNKIYAERLANKGEVNAKIEGLFTTMDQMIDEAKQLSEHPSIVSGSGLTGVVMRNIPDITEQGAFNFGERLKSLGAQIGFNALQNMREMSKTGGALGQVSDFENRRLEASISALNAMQTPGDIKRALRQVINYADAAKKNMKSAYERTYGEKLPDLEKREIVPPNKQPNEAKREITATGPNGEKIVFRNGKWQPMQ